MRTEAPGNLYDCTAIVNILHEPIHTKPIHAYTVYTTVPT
jgi:hypothetical protein